MKMITKLSKIIFTITVTAPIFFSLGLIGVVKDSDNYFSNWKSIFHYREIPNEFQWWEINFSFLLALLSLVCLRTYLNKRYKKTKEAKTIKPESYSNRSQNSIDQVLSSIIPWLTLFADNLDFNVLFFCVLLQCCLIAFASYNNSNYNLLCSLLGYRYYEVKTKENTYTLLSKECIKNKKEITKYIEITDYMGLMIK